ncbi:MAG: nucleotidyl transferase AbiEii/AbiGii toxin family protein [Scytonematopsis contorta HA4267-MV1]|jgi:predicted nucleotidyltransferase component of viral defense system|nr:nucleotidyl transferase AbiEii/AbiGii toxin family protein [Scytonematopsis contorta HA4267-MV1]
MNQKQIRNIPASIRSKLLQLSKQRGEDFNYLLVRYTSDRLLYRLSQSPYQKQFILKGATLFRVWNGEPHRATKDLDLLSFGRNDISSLEEVFKEICRQEYEPDGISFESETVKGEKIKEDQEYEGVRINLQAKLDSAKISIQVDIGFGDAVTPSPEEALLPSILDLPAPVLQIYRRETVVAEKFQAMVALGISNSRLKDFYDIWFLCHNFEFEGDLLSQAIKATFERRKTSLPTIEPLALTAEFAEDITKKKQWRAFLNKGKLKSEHKHFVQVTDIIRDFLMPPCLAAIKDETFNRRWYPSNGWQS